MTLAIDIRDLCKSYGSRSIVKGLTLSVERGSIYGLLGPNGSGKTTTLACALGLLRPTSGSAHVLGEPYDRVHRLQGRLSVVFDTAIALPGLTANQNLDYVRQLLGHGRGRGNAEVLEAVNLAEHANSKVRSLSLGQAKRLAIAGALLGEPELLVLDEPLSGLDTMGVRRMLRMFEGLREQGMTLLLSSHRLVEMQTVVTHVGILYGGRIEKGGPIDEILGRTENRQRFTVDQVEKASKLLSGLAGVDCRTAEDAPDGSKCLSVRSKELPIAELNRRLVEQGVEVSGIEAATHTLQSVFEDLVDSHEVVA